MQWFQLSFLSYNFLESNFFNRIPVICSVVPGIGGAYLSQKEKTLRQPTTKSVFHMVENFGDVSHFLHISEYYEISRASYQVGACNPTLCDKEPV